MQVELNNPKVKWNRKHKKLTKLEYDNKDLILLLHELNIYDEEVIKFIYTINLDDEQSVKRGSKSNFQAHDQ